VKNVGDKPGTNLGTKITRAEMTTYRNKQGYFEQSGTKRGQLRGQNKNAWNDVVASKQKKNVAKTAILSPNLTPLYIYRIALSLYAYRLFLFLGTKQNY